MCFEQISNDMFSINLIPNSNCAELPFENKKDKRASVRKKITARVAEALYFQLKSLTTGAAFGSCTDQFKRNQPASSFRLMFERKYSDSAADHVFSDYALPAFAQKSVRQESKLFCLSTLQTPIMLFAHQSCRERASSFLFREDGSWLL